jgi:type IV secretory pathway protease TraF
MTGARIAPLVVAAAVAACLTAFPRAAPAPWLINETPSMPRGLYRRTPDTPRPGALVSLEPPAAARSYLASLGAPPDARLLKRVVAGPGERVCSDGARLTWPQGSAVRLARDRQGRALSVWRGCRPLGADELLVVGDSPASFDSRYFGPVRQAAVLGVYREVWRW